MLQGSGENLINPEYDATCESGVSRFQLTMFNLFYTILAMFQAYLRSNCFILRCANLMQSFKFVTSICQLHLGLEIKNQLGPNFKLIVLKTQLRCLLKILYIFTIHLQSTVLTVSSHDKHCWILAYSLLS